WPPRRRSSPSGPRAPAARRRGAARRWTRSLPVEGGARRGRSRRARAGQSTRASQAHLPALVGGAGSRGAGRRLTAERDAALEYADGRLPAWAGRRRAPIAPEAGRERGHVAAVGGKASRVVEEGDLVAEALVAGGGERRAHLGARRGHVGDVGGLVD